MVTYNIQLFIEVVMVTYNILLSIEVVMVTTFQSFIKVVLVM